MWVDELFFLWSLDTVSSLGHTTSLFALIFLWYTAVCLKPLVSNVSGHWFMVSAGFNCGSSCSGFSLLSNLPLCRRLLSLWQRQLVDSVCSVVFAIHSLIYWTENQQWLVSKATAVSEEWWRSGEVWGRWSVLVVSSTSPYICSFVSRASVWMLRSNSFCVHYTWGETEMKHLSFGFLKACCWPAFCTCQSHQ